MDVLSLRHFDLNLLLSLHVLLKLKNVTHAAQVLNISQPALSAQLARLRHSFQDQLLVPSTHGKGMVLTEKAEVLIEPLETLVNQLQLIHQTEPSFDPEHDERIFKIAVSDSASVSLSRVIADFLATLTNNIKIEFVHCEPAKLTEQLEQDQLDLVIDLENNLPDHFPGLMLIDEDFVLCFGLQHPLSQQRTLSVEEYCSLKHIIVKTDDQSFTGYTDLSLKMLGHKRVIQHSLSSFVMATQCLIYSDYVCTLPRHLVQHASEPLQFLELPFISPRYKLRMLWHPKKQDNPAILWLRHMIYTFVRGE
ncbi:Nodulation protein D 2 [Acinetobacter stercoris]|uniref:Nodulation protein D 2 n=1 Tax=Acinetobacter stercoris TaxID=2126983 RepID=A0A2U3N0Y9_9GAMM|nr:Nodulation protein D 2 [Acinetobacter stercoris]